MSKPPNRRLGHRRIPRPSTEQVVTIGFTAMACVALYTWLPMWITELQRRMICIFVVAAVFWAREVLPLYATSLMAIGVMILTLATDGGLARALPSIGHFPQDIDVSYKEFLVAFGSNIIILFMGGFLLSRALTKHHIDRAIAANVLQPFTSSPLLMIYGVLGISAFFSMWMSNTATAAMMIAIIRPILKQLSPDDRFRRGLVLAVPLGANIGGIGTPIGTPPNAIAYAAINAMEEKSISFLTWMMIAVPLAVVLLAGVGLLLYLAHRPTGEQKLPAIRRPRLISWYGYLTVSILIAAVALWLTGELHGINAGSVALLAAGALAALQVLDRHDVDSIDWDILILMWGGLAMGAGMQQSGLTHLIAGADLTAVPGGSLGLATLVVAVSICLSTLMSNMATANLIIPITMALALAAQERIQLAILCALGCSFAMAMPVSTPPNAIAYATGEIRSSTLMIFGGAISILAGALLVFGYPIVLPMILES